MAPFDSAFASEGMQSHGGARAALRSGCLVLAAGVLLSIGAAFWQHAFNQSVVRERLSIVSDTIANHTSQRMAVYQYGLRGLRGLIVAIGVRDFTVPDLERYGRTRDLALEFPGARGMGFIQRVPRSRVTAFEQTLRKDGAPGANIHELAPHDGERFVIRYVEPLAGNQAAIGLDIASEPHRRDAAMTAMDTGLARLTAPITLVQESGKPQQSFLLLLPVYDPALVSPAGTPRRESLVGWTYAPLVTEDMLRTLALDQRRIALSITDITDPARQIGIRALPQPLDVTPHVHRADIEVYGRRWRMAFHARPAFIAAQGTISPQWILLGGLAVSGLAAALRGSMVADAWRRRQAAAVQGRLAAIVENSNDAILGHTLNGVVTTWNRGAEALFGYTPEEALDKTVAELIVPLPLRQEEADILAKLGRGEAVPHFDTTRVRRDGSLVKVSVTASPIVDASGAIIGASKTVRDITERKAMEALAERTYRDMANEVSSRTAQLRRLNILLDSVLGSLELMIIATDEGGTITVFSHGAEHVLGYAAAEMVGRATLAMLASPVQTWEGLGDAAVMSDSNDAMRAVLRAACEQAPETFDWTYVRRDGQEIPVSVAISALNEGGKLTGYLSIAMDASQLRLAQQELQRQHAELLMARDHLLLAADVARLGVWSWLLDERRPEWNAHMFAIYGITPGSGGEAPTIDEWLGLIHPDDVADARATLDAVMAGRGEDDRLLRIVQPDGQVRYLQAAARTEYSKDGKARRITGISLDVTERMELVNTLQLAKAHADATSKAKSAFLANMSHEIRTPLNAVMGMLQILQHSGLSPEQCDYAEKASSAARSLLQLLNDLLDYSKIEAGKLVLDIHAFDLRELLDDLSSVLAGTQGAKDIEVIFDIDPDLPASLLGDRLRLQQVLINLAGNALKFTERGNVVLSVKHLAGSQPLVIRFAVADTGIGIAPHHKQGIFKGFTQAEASTSRRFGGTGLGLAICQRLVSMMGAELSLESELGKGSLFWFDLEMQRVGDDDLSIASAPPIPVVHVLVVDDNPLAAALLAQMIEALGWRAWSVGSGADAIAAVEAAARDGEPFDVVLMDWLMPGMNGVIAAREIAAMNRIPRPPVIFMVTAYGREALNSYRQEGGNITVAGLLTKPVMPQSVVDAVSRALNPVSTAEKQAGRTLRLKGKRILVAEDNELNQEVAAALLRQEGANVTLAWNGNEAVSFAGTQVFDAVLMDMQMPEMDGLDATRRLRADARFSGLPIIAMTANASAADRDRCLAAGMNGHIAKPIDIGQVVAALEQQFAHIEATGQGGAVESLADILQRFGGAIDIYERMLDALPRQADKLMTEAEACLAAQDRAGASVALHTLKGTASTFGAIEFAATIRAMEPTLRDEVTASPQVAVAPLRASFAFAFSNLKAQLMANRSTSGSG